MSLSQPARLAAVVAFTASLLGHLTLARTYGPGAVLIIEGTWYLGEGVRFDVAKLTGYPSGH